MTAKVLVAGIGNIFLGDDGFGVEVARRLVAEGGLPEDVSVQDFGIRGVHLAFELMNGYGAAILVDAMARGEAPGTVSLVDLNDRDEESEPVPEPGPEVLLDAHGMQPDAVLALLTRHGVAVDRIVLVGCEPLDVSDGMGLSDPVSAAVEEAIGLVRLLVEEAVGGLSPGADTVKKGVG